MAGHRNKDVDFVPWVGDRTGELFFIPGFSLPVSLCPASSGWRHVLTDTPRHATIWQGATAQHARSTFGPTWWYEKGLRQRWWRRSFEACGFIAEAPAVAAPGVPKLLLELLVCLLLRLPPCSSKRCITARAGSLAAWQASQWL